MEWLKLDLRTLRSPEYIGSEPTARATWLNLLAYCADEENGGRIVGCEEWKDRMWQQLAGVTHEEVRESSELFTWDGSDLIIWNYPSNTENLVKTRREAGRRGGAQSSEEANAKQNSDLLQAKPDFASTEQSRAEESRPDKSRAEQRGASGCKFLRMDAVCEWIEAQNGSIPDKPRAISLAQELVDEMNAKKWRVQGQQVDNPMGLLVARLKRDKAYLPKE